MPLVDAEITVDHRTVVLGAVNPSVAVTVEIPVSECVIAGAPGIRGPRGETGANVFIGQTPPAEPVEGSLWFKSDVGIRYLWYVDDDGGQWVADSGASGTAAIGGAGFAITNLAADDTLIYNGTAWTNAPKVTLTDGGNF